MTLDEFNKRRNKIPESPGVYFFLGSRKKILYIGKAAVLRDRTRSYFSPDLVETRGEHMVQMVKKARAIEWRTTDSVLEALILESNLIKTHKPEYNTLGLDDKSFNYVVITREKFPRVMLIRGRELRQGSTLAHGSQGRTLKLNAAIGTTYGPFPHGAQLKLAMKIVRRIFPYRDACLPCEELLKAKNSKLTTSCKPCFNRQIGLCPGVCTGEASAAQYARSIRRIKLFFAGRKQELVGELERDMKEAAKEERFEDAGEHKRQLFALRHIQDVALIKQEYREPAAVRAGEEERIVMRIEAYDVAHLRGQAAYGVMTVVENGESVPQEYRLFRIRTAKPGDDPGALSEVLSRRLVHDEWPMPRLIAVDGAAAQMNAARRVVGGAGLSIPIVGVVKDEKHRPREIRAGANASREIVTRHERSILLGNAEAHRFAISRHRKTLRASLTRIRR